MICIGLTDHNNVVAINLMNLQINIKNAGTLVVLPVLSGYFQLPDGVIGMAALIGDVVFCLICAFATVPLTLYLGNNF